MSEYTPKRAKQEDKKSKSKLWIVLAVILALIIALGSYAFIEAVRLRGEAYAMKDALANTVGLAKAGDMVGAEASIGEVEEKADKVSARLSSPLWKIGAKAPIVGGDISSVSNLVNIIDDAIDNIVPTIFDTLKGYPLTSLNQDEGINVKTILAYIDLVEGIAPKLDKYAQSLSEVSFRFIDLGSYSEYIEDLSKLSDKYDSIVDYLKFAKMVLGDGEDRFYLLAAQNSAEIRASGGFPGSIGSVSIKDGFLTVGDFKPVNSVLLRNNPANAQATSTELKLFSFWVNYPRDFDYNPNFERVGYNWAESYMGQEKVNGVISLAPTIIQSLLKSMDQSITLSDGTVMDGTNATKVIQHDLYYKYLTADESAINHNTDDMVDALFAETAKQTMDLFFSSISVSNIGNIIDLLSAGMENRTIMLWMEDEQSQQMVKDFGFSGGLGDDETKPIAGVYFSCSVSSKLGWFFSLDTKIDDVKDNADGSKTYNITVELSNLITDEDLKVGTYILGATRGTIGGYLHLFAPVGGTIDNVKSSNGVNFIMGSYEGLDVAYTQNMSLAKDKPVTVTYTVTTSPKAVEGLVIQSTPTLQEYH